MKDCVVTFLENAKAGRLDIVLSLRVKAVRTVMHIIKFAAEKFVRGNLRNSAEKIKK